MSVIAYRKRVARGAALLDEKMPGWADRIDLARLRMHDCYSCVLGQVFADSEPDRLPACTPYGVGVVTLIRPSVSASAFGFDGEDADALAAEWTRLITERRAAR